MSEARKGGFTLLELLIIVAVIGILASIAIPKMTSLIRNANEGATKGKLGSIRKALSLYYVDNEQFPGELTPFTQPGNKYLTGMVPMYTHEHGNSSGIEYLSAETYGDGGGWAYVNEGGSWGKVWARCTHTDLKDNVWTSY